MGWDTISPLTYQNNTHFETYMKETDLKQQILMENLVPENLVGGDFNLPDIDWLLENIDKHQYCKGRCYKDYKD